MSNNLLDKLPGLGQGARGLQKDTFLDKVYQFLADESSVSLTDAEKNRLDRLHHAFALQRQGYNDKAASNILMRQYGLSRATHYRDLSDAKEFFGDVQKSSKEAERHLMGQMLLDAYRLARKGKDFKAMVKAMEVRAKILGLDKQTEQIDPATLGGNTYLLQINLGGAGAGPGGPQTIDLTNPAGLGPQALGQVLGALQQADQLTQAQLLQQLEQSEREGAQDE